MPNRIMKVSLLVIPNIKASVNLHAEKVVGDAVADVRNGGLRSQSVHCVSAGSATVEGCTTGLPHRSTERRGFAWIWGMNLLLPRALAAWSTMRQQTNGSTSTNIWGRIACRYSRSNRFPPRLHLLVLRAFTKAEIRTSNINTYFLYDLGHLRNRFEVEKTQS